MKHVNNKFKIYQDLEKLRTKLKDFVDFYVDHLKSQSYIEDNEEEKLCEALKSNLFDMKAGLKNSLQGRYALTLQKAGLISYDDLINIQLSDLLSIKQISFKKLQSIIKDFSSKLTHMNSDKAKIKN